MISFFIVLLPDALRLKADLTFDLAALGMSPPNFAEIVDVIVHASGNANNKVGSG